MECSEDASAADSARSKMAAVMARTQHAADFRREGGINAAAGAVDDTLTTMAEEQAHRVSRRRNKAKLTRLRYVSPKYSADIHSVSLHI